MNQVILIGNLTGDPELRYVNTANGQKAKCRFVLAVNDSKENANFIPIVVWDRQAENCEKFLSKGRKIAVSGKIQTGSYQRQDGTKVHTTDVVAFNVEFLSQNQESQDEHWKPAEGFKGQHVEAKPEYVSRKQYEQEKQMPAGFEAMAEQESIPF